MLTEITVRHDRKSGYYKATVQKKNGKAHTAAGLTVREAISGLVEQLELCTPDVILTEAVDLAVLQGVTDVFGDNVFRLTWEL